MRVTNSLLIQRLFVVFKNSLILYYLFLKVSIAYFYYVQIIRYIFLSIRAHNHKKEYKIDARRDYLFVVYVNCVSKYIKITNYLS